MLYIATMWRTYGLCAEDRFEEVTFNIPEIDRSIRFVKEYKPDHPRSVDGMMLCSTSNLTPTEILAVFNAYPTLVSKFVLLDAAAIDYVV